MASVPHPSCLPLGRLAVLGATILLPSLAASASNVALPALAWDFAVSTGDAQWVVTAYLAAITATLVLAGRAGDRLGRRRVLVVGSGVFAAASVLCGLAPTLDVLVAGRVLQGIGAAAMMALTLSFVGDVVAAERAGSAMGFLGTSSAVGTALGPMVGGVLISAFGWPVLFLFMVVPALVLMVLAQRCLPIGEASGRRAPGAPAPAGGRARLWGGLVASALVAAILMSTLVVGPFYLSAGAGLSPMRFGAVMSIGPAVAAVVGFPAGWLVDRSGSFRATLVGVTGIGGGSVMLALLPPVFGVIGYGCGLVLLTASYALFQAANNTAMLACAGAGQRGTVSGMLNLARNLGLLAGSSMLGGIFAASIPDMGQASPEMVGDGVRRVFLIASVLAAVAALSVIGTGRAGKG